MPGRPWRALFACDRFLVKVLFARPMISNLIRSRNVPVIIIRMFPTRQKLCPWFMLGRRAVHAPFHERGQSQPESPDRIKIDGDTSSCGWMRRKLRLTAQHSIVMCTFAFHSSKSFRPAVRYLVLMDVVVQGVCRKLLEAYQNRQATHQIHLTHQPYL